MAKRDNQHLDGEGIKKYDRMRQYLDLIYLYGCFDAKTLAKINNRSVKDYYAVMDMMRDVFWQEDDPREGQQNNPRILRKYAESAQNRMTDSYMMFSMDKVSLLLLYLRLLQELRQGVTDVPRLQVLLDELPVFMGETGQNARNHLLEMKHYGYITVSHAKYRLSPDKLCLLSSEMLLELYTYVCFAAGVTYPRVPGSFLRRTLERELRSRNLPIPEDSVFLLRNNSHRNVFDEEVVFRLLRMIQNRQALTIDGREYLPVKLRIDCRLGRWYLLAAGEYQGKLQPVMWAVSRLELPVPSNTTNNLRWEEAAQVVEMAYPESESLFSGRQTETAVLVEAKLHFGEEKGRQEQFRRELRIGSIESIDGVLFYRAYIRDPLELLPLLRAYAPWLEVLPGEHDLCARMAEALQQIQDGLDQADWPPHSENYRTMEKRTSKQPKAQKDLLKRQKIPTDDRKLLNPFQSRLMQFCLDILSDPQQDGSENDAVKKLAKRYGIHQYKNILDWLTQSGFFVQMDARPRLPMSLMEQEYLQYILDPQHMPEVLLFLSEQTRQALAGSAPSWLAHIQWKKAPGMQLPQNPGPEGFQDIIRAIRQRRMIGYRYRVRGNQGENAAVCLPWKLEYSAYDRRWWVILYDTNDDRTIKVPLNHLRDIRILSESSVTDQRIVASMEKLRMKQPVELHIRDSHNALQRCFTVFENQEMIGSSYSPEAGYVLLLNAFRFDREEILRQLLYLGPNVRLEAPQDMKKELRARIIQAKAHFDTAK